MLKTLKEDGNKVIAYGAASKVTTVFNYCGIDESLVEYITDTTPSKIGKYQPGTHIPIVSPQHMLQLQPDYMLLLAWNFVDEIIEQQTDFRSTGGQFIVPVPEVKII